MNDLADNQTEDVTRALPHSLMAEKSVLSHILREPLEAVPECLELGLREDDFYLPAHRELWMAISVMAEKSEGIDLVMFTQHLLDNGKLDRVGGPSAIADIYSYNVAPNMIRLINYIRMIKDKSILRGIIAGANEAIREAYESPEDPTAALDALDSRISAIREDRETQSTVRRVSGDVKAIMQTVIDSINRREPVKPRGIQTGFDDIDRMSGGLIPGEMFVIAARPSVGKTSLMMNIVENISVDQTIPTAVFSLEMPRDAVVRRLMFGRSRCAATSNAYEWNKGELIRFQRASQEITEAPLWIDDRSGLTVQEIRAKARRLHREHGIRLIAVDYLQLCRSRTKQANNSREREIGEISQGLKEIAKELNVPVLVLAQLNRDVDRRTGANAGRPRMSDLRESGSIEQDADLVGMLWRKDYQATPEDAELFAGVSTLTIAKNRNGETGDCPLTFIANLCRYETGQPATQSEEPTIRSRFDD